VTPAPGEGPPTGVAVVHRLADLCPWTPGDAPDLSRSLAFLGWPVDAATVLRAGDVTGLFAGLTAAALAAFAPVPPSASLGVGTAVGLVVAVSARGAPRLLATARRTRALGAAPGLVSRAVLRMRLSPTPETAAAFAAETGSGPLAESLAAHVRRGRREGRSGLGSFADEWAEWFPSLRRACTLVESAGSAPSGERDRALETALTATLDGTRERMAAFAAAVRGPTTALYAFGVLLPLALVALLPAAGTAGLSVPPAAVIVLLDLALPCALLAASAWLLARRPAAFPPPTVGRSHPEVPRRRWPWLVAGVLAGAAGWLLAGRLVAPWAGPPAGAGVGLGTALVGTCRPLVDAAERTRAVERGVPDALYLVGREVQRGRAVERALAEAAETVDGPTGEVLADAAGRQHRLRVGVREAFLGDHGALATVPSERVRNTVALLALAAAEGRPAGRAIVAMADHLEDLQSVEREARREIRRVTATLSNTALAFAPLVGGATVTLAERMATGGPLSEGAAPPAVLGPAVGAYVLVLAALLATLATGLTRGLDRALVGYRVGRALLSATVVFHAALVVTRGML